MLKKYIIEEDDMEGTYILEKNGLKVRERYDETFTIECCSGGSSIELGTIKKEGKNDVLYLELHDSVSMAVHKTIMWLLAMVRAYLGVKEEVSSFIEDVERDVEEIVLWLAERLGVPGSGEVHSDSVLHLIDIRKLVYDRVYEEINDLFERRK